jgi:hypothetical protein
MCMTCVKTYVMHIFAVIGFSLDCEECALPGSAPVTQLPVENLKSEYRKWEEIWIISRLF